MVDPLVLDFFNTILSRDSDSSINSYIWGKIKLAMSSILVQCLARATFFLSFFRYQEEHCMSKNNTYWHLANSDSGMDFITNVYEEQMYGSWLAGNRDALLKIMRFSQVSLQRSWLVHVMCFTYYFAVA